MAEKKADHKAGKTQKPVFYILHGEDEFNRKAYLGELRASINDPSQLNTTVMDGSQVSVGQMINAASSVPFLADRRMVIVNGFLENLGDSKAAKQTLDELAERLENLPDFACLVLHEAKVLGEKHKLLGFVQGHPRGQEVKFTVPKDLAKWISNHARQTYAIEIEPAAATALASVIHQDLRAADSEIAKLAAYVNFSRPITEKDVATMTTYVADAVIFDMVDALGRRDGKSALELTQKLLDQGGEVLMLLGMVNRQFRLLILTKEYLEEGGSQNGVATAIGVHPFVAGKLVSQARKFPSLAALEGIYRRLAKLDDEIKTSRMNDEMAIQVFIAQVTA